MQPNRDSAGDDKRRDGVREVSVAELRQFDLECGIEDHGMVEHKTKNGVLRYRVGSYVR